MTVLIILALFVCIGLLIGSFATESAPVGYEDETGFHYGSQPGATLSDREAMLHDVGSLAPKHA